MNITAHECTPGYPVSGGFVASMVDRKRAHAAAFMQLGGVQWLRYARNVDVVRVQTVITDVPGRRSAPPSVRRT